ERTILDKIRPTPSLCRSTTAAAVSSQVVSMPRTRAGLSLSNLRPCVAGQTGVFLEALAYHCEAITCNLPLMQQPCRRKPDMAILVTRPQPDNETTAAALRAKGFAVLPAPMLRFEPLAFHDDADARYGAVIVSSANALRAIEADLAGSRLLTLPLFAVGER